MRVSHLNHLCVPSDTYYYAQDPSMDPQLLSTWKSPALAPSRAGGGACAEQEEVQSKPPFVGVWR